MSDSPSLTPVSNAPADVQAPAIAASADAPPVWGPTVERKPTRQKLETARDCSRLLARYVRKWMDGKVRIDDVSKLAHIMQVQVRLIEGSTLEQRLETLEKAAAARVGHVRAA